MTSEAGWWDEQIVMPSGAFTPAGSIHLGETMTCSMTRAHFAARTATQAIKHTRVRGAVLDSISGCLFNQGRLLPQTAGLLYANEEQAARARARSPLFEIRGRRVFSIFHRWAGANYGHWIAQVLPALFHFMADPEFASSVLLLPKMPFASQRSSLHRLLRELPDHKFVEDNEAIFCDDITISSLLTDWLADVDTASQSMYNAITDPRWRQSGFVTDTPKTMIYYWRQDSAARTMRNESELIEMLAQFGIIPVICGTMSFREQVEAFSSASLVVGAHGAGLLNVAFCRPGATLYELFPGHFMPTLANRIAQARGLHYWADQFEPDPVPELDGTGMEVEMLKRRSRTWAVDIPYIKARIEAIFDSMMPEFGPPGWRAVVDGKREMSVVR
jgi:hypothetical protein